MMIMKRLFYLITIASVALLSGCSSEDTSDAIPDGALEFTINPSIAGSATTRLDNDTVVGSDARSSFVEGDKIYLTKLARTNHPVSAFSYPNTTYPTVSYTRNNANGWNADNLSQKLYWTDTNEHTVIGYSLGSSTASWTADASGVYTGTLSADQTSLASFKAQDVLLSYADTVKASPTTSLAAADIVFHHGLAKVYTKVVLTGFAATVSSTLDIKTSLKSVSLDSQPTSYTWDQKGFQVAAVDGSGSNTTLNLWNAESQGTNNDKVFLGYGIVVPGKRTFNMLMSVSYPNAQDTLETVTDTYTASFPDITFTAGKRTSLIVTLNHEKGTITTSCTLADWDNVSGKDDYEELLKYGNCLQTVDMTKVKLATAVTSLNDATWLYTDGTAVKDRYGNEGTEASPYEIRNAFDLLCLADEVNNGRTFEGQYIKMTSDIYLQPSVTGYSLAWPGIGDATHSFAGTFLGKGKNIFSLNGNPLFASLASTAKVNNLTVRTYQYGSAVSSVSAATAGILCGTNNGRIEGCTTMGKVSGTATAGGIVGINAGYIFASYHQGAVSGVTTGGIAGTNSGTVVACYQGAGALTGTTSLGGVTATNTGTLSYCYYDATTGAKATAAVPGTADTETEKGLPLTSMEGTTFVTTLNTGISTWNTAHTDNPISTQYLLKLSGLPILKY
jgi:hypothetical protein